MIISSHNLRERNANCYKTFDVIVDGEVIGCIQQIDATGGLTATKRARDLWLVWTGNPHQGKPNGPDAHPRQGREDAIRYILQAHHA